MKVLEFIVKAIFWVKMLWLWVRRIRTGSWDGQKRDMK